MTVFSVVIPLYNKAQFVRDCVRSVLDQTLGDLEAIVVDDGSTDGGAATLGDIADSRLRVVVMRNSGVSAARNAGVALATGDYVCFLDADDWWGAHHLEAIRDLIEFDAVAIAWATGYTETTGPSDDAIQVDDRTGERAFGSVSYDLADFLTAWARAPILCTDSITVRRMTLISMQPCFPPGETHAEDQDLWLRLAERGTIRFRDVRDNVFYRRNVCQSLTHSVVLAPLPTYRRLYVRSRTYTGRSRTAARRLYGSHLLHVAWANCVCARRAAALAYLFRVAPWVRPGYWMRILCCIALPNGTLRALLRYSGTSSLRVPITTGPEHQPPRP